MVLNNNERIHRVPPSRVYLSDDYLRRAFLLETKYLLSIDEDRLLCGFRETAGLDCRGGRRYGGWENSLIGGHTMGHYLSAAARACICTEASGEDRRALREKVCRIVDELTICQEHSRGGKGFLFGATLADPKHVEKQFDNVEQGLTNIMTESWVPWYTMHKILAGLLDVYRYTAYEPALTAAKNLGDWVADRSLSWDADTARQVLAIEYGGMNDCMYALYAYTGDARHAKAAHVFDEEALFERVLSGGKNVLNDRHANTTIPKFVGALNRYFVLHGTKIDGAIVDASRYLSYAKAFWEMVITHHTYITGGNSEWEHFGMDGILNAERTNCNNETCNVYNLLKLSEGLYRITGEKKYMDFYERAFVNTILSSQNPTTGMTTYFQPMANGYFKVYATPYDKFWCCTGSGMENFTRLNEGIYHIREREILVNLYFSSGCTAQGITLTQECNPKASDVVTLVVETQNSNPATGAASTQNTNPVPDAAATQVPDRAPWILKLRIPDWVKGEISLQKIAETGESIPVSYKIEDGYAVVALTENKSKLALTLPKKICAEGLPDAPDVVGFSYGPYVLSADLGTKDMRTTVTGVDVTIPAEKIEDCDALTLPWGVAAEDVLADANRFFRKADEAEEVISRTSDEEEECLPRSNHAECEFRFAGSELIFSPHYRKYKSRYGIYWKLTPQRDGQEAGGSAPTAPEEKIIDTIQPGYGQYENDNLHRMTEHHSRGITNEGTCRYALPGGFFGYRIAVEPDRENILEFTVKKEDAGKHLKVTAQDRILFDSSLDVSRSPEADTPAVVSGSPEANTPEASAGAVLTDNAEYQLRLPIPADVLAQAKDFIANGQLYHTVELRFSGKEEEASARVCKFIYVKISRGDRQQ